MNIAVFVFAYPVLSETFVINELYQLEQAGVSGSIWREKVADGTIHPKAKKISWEVHDLPAQVLGDHFWQTLLAHLRWLIKKPAVYVGLFGEILRYFPDLESIKICWKSAMVAEEVVHAGSAVIYVHESDRAFVFGLSVARLCELPLVIIFHTYYLFVKPNYIFSKVHCADKVIFQSEFSRQYIAQELEKLKKNSQLLQKMEVVSSPGIDTEFFSPVKRSSKKLHQIKIVSVGRLEEAKSFGSLIEAVYLLKQKGGRVSCTIIGEGTQRSQLEKLIEKYKLGKQVKLPGSLPHTSRLQRALRSADFFVLPSVQDREGVHDVHPNVVKEAMATGLLTITTQLGGIDEVITDGKDGFLVSAASPQLLCQKIEEVLALSIDQQNTVRKNARKKIEYQFAARQVTQQLLRVFSAVRQLGY